MKWAVCIIFYPTPISCSAGISTRMLAPVTPTATRTPEPTNFPITNAPRDTKSCTKAYQYTNSSAHPNPNTRSNTQA